MQTAPTGPGEESEDDIGGNNPCPSVLTVFYFFHYLIPKYSFLANVHINRGIDIAILEKSVKFYSINQ